jgi:hypothetical protein
VACIPVDPKNIESKDQLWSKYRHLMAAAAAPPAGEAR